MIDPKDVLLGDKIVGIENTTLTSHGPGAIDAKPMKVPPELTAVQWAKHALSHLPYHPGCSICRACKMPNIAHMKSHEADRTIPLLVGDYAFCRDSKDEGLATLLVLRLLPYRLTFAFVVAAKGSDPLVVARIARLITECGLVHFAYRSDKEPAIISMIQDACAMAGRKGVHVKGDDDTPVILEAGDSQTGELQEDEHPRAVESAHLAVPEHSHPGESQSNGIAERAVQDLVNHVRVLKLSLESNIKARLPAEHPIMAWLVEHAAYLLNRFVLGTDGRTAWGRLHGKECTERICEFGEKILWYVPKKQRAKLDVRWRHGLFLGRSMNSDQNFIGLPDGSVTCARAMVRLVPKKRWDMAQLGNLTAMPMDYKTKHLDIIEQGPEPHEHAPGEDVDVGDGDEHKKRRMQVSWQNLQDYGFTPNCPRCSLHRQGLHARAKHSRHNEVCRSRIYQEIRANLRTVDPEDEKRLEVKRKPTPEPKADEAVPETPRGLEEPAHDDAAMDEAVLGGDVDLDDAGMDQADNADTSGFYREVDDAMAEDNADTEMMAIMDVLQTLGVDVEDANRFSAKVIRAARGDSHPTFVEAYGTGRIVEQANNVLRNLNVKGLAAFDLRTCKENGTPWDFSKVSDRKEALRFVKEKRPSWIVGSPPCTAFSQLQGLNFKKMSPDRVKSILSEGRRHLNFVISLYKIQLDEGRHFLHEHHAFARS